MSDQKTEWAIPVETKTIHAINSFDLERLVNETYGFKDWSFQANEEASNDSDHEFDSTGKYVDEEEFAELIEWAAGEDAYDMIFRTGLILTDLANKELLPKGDILVSLSY